MWNKDVLIYFQISKLLDSKEPCLVSDDSLLYDSPARGIVKDDLYGQIINGVSSSDKRPARPKMALPEIGESSFIVLVLPIRMNSKCLDSDWPTQTDHRSETNFSILIGQKQLPMFTS